ncbi:MAG: energy transducer TonB [candidate division Zixibacteria bacterium]|nr:energy transducer TonB [candidate division Zixibacteria bacterium]
MATSALWSPYGAFELKSRYQRNFLLGTGVMLGAVLVILVVAWIISALPEEEIDALAGMHVVKTVADLGPPPSIARKPPQLSVSAPQTAAPKVGIPKPVADDEVLDEDVVLATREELAEIVAPDISSAADGDEIIIDISDDDYLPAPDEFVPVEIYPEMVYQHKPDYPRLARTAGITGVVWVQALVDKEGNVRRAQVGKSSGTASLDEAAVEAAYKNKFKPGIQNGRPVACWVTYKMDFILGDQ